MRRILVLFAVLLVAVYAGVSVYAADVFTRVERKAPDLSALTQVGAPFEDVSFRTTDGLLLKGWLFPRGSRAVVIVHGKETRRLDGERSIDLGRVLAAAGYSVLAFDLRGHGESEGERFSLGEYERLDVVAAIEYLEGRGYATKDIGLFGESMGAGTVLQALALRADIGPVVVDSPYESVTLEVSEHFTAESGLPAFFVPGVIAAARIFGMDASAIVDPITVVRAHPERPFLFIHCTNDAVVEVHHSYDLRAASANPESELWVVEGCEHVKAHELRPAEFESRVLSFYAKQFR